MDISQQEREAWQVFLGNQDNRGHASRELSGPDIDSHVNACWKSAMATAIRVKSDLPTLYPKRILEIGCSAGLNCYALQKVYPNAEVLGVEPEREAINVAKAKLYDGLANQPIFQQGYGEQLPLQDRSVDLIVCHTVIEHVNDVEAVIGEMARVLSPSGAVHLDAPNYRFPYEPHLEIFTIPELGKGFVKFTALMQGRWEQRHFVNHLKFVTPSMLQRHFKKHGLLWHNRALDKLKAAVKGEGEIKKYRAISRLLNLLSRLGIGPLIIFTIGALGLYPSVLFTLRKKSGA